MKFKNIDFEIFSLTKFIKNKYGIKADLIWNDNGLYIVEIKRDRDSKKIFPSSGYFAMQKIVQFADKKEVDIGLVAAQISPFVSLKNLINFYNSFGFKIERQLDNDCIYMKRKYKSTPAKNRT